VYSGPAPSVTGLDSWRQQLQADGLSYPLGIDAAGDWSIREVPDWVSISASEGTGRQTITVTVAPNSEGAERVAILDLGGARHAVVQAAISGSDSVAISPLSRWSRANANTYILRVTTRGAWNLGNLPDWLTASSTSGTGDAEITLSLAANAG